MHRTAIRQIHLRYGCCINLGCNCVGLLGFCVGLLGFEPSVAALYSPAPLVQFGQGCFDPLHGFANQRLGSGIGEANVVGGIKSCSSHTGHMCLFE